MKQHTIKATAVAIIVLLYMAGARTHNLMSSPDTVAIALGVMMVDPEMKGAALRDVQVYPGFVLVSSGTGEPDVWVNRWYRELDIEYQRTSHGMPQASWVEYDGRKLVIRHQEQLDKHGDLALAAIVMAAKLFTLVVVPLLSAVGIGFITLLILAVREDERHHRLARHRHNRPSRA